MTAARARQAPEIGLVTDAIGPRTKWDIDAILMR
jgi:hypothetical protein